MVSLKDVIKALTYKSKMHICIHDVSGITSVEGINPDYSNMIHSSDFCACAKTTERGLELCMRCKRLANNKAIAEKSEFVGKCPLAITEVVHPVVINSRVMCIIYIGNLCADENEIKKSAEKISPLTGVPKSEIGRFISETESFSDISPYRNVAAVLDGFIKMMYDMNGKKSANVNGSIVSAFIGYAEKHYNKNITISRLADLFYMNRKYAGRIFKAECGMSFNRYLNVLRTENAKKLLKNTDMNIIDIAMECGYNNVTYFNKVFKNVTGMTPLEYRNL